MHPMTGTLRDDVRNLVRLTTCIERDDPVVADALHGPRWSSIVAAGHADIIVGGAVAGALDALQLRCASPVDALTASFEHPHIDDESLQVAAGWVASALMEPNDPWATQAMVTQSMVSQSWNDKRHRAEALVLAVGVIALRTSRIARDTR